MRVSKALGCAGAILFLQFLGCAPGSGGGGGTPTFRSGFVYVRQDDRNVYLADDSAPSTPIPVTTNGSNRMPSLSRDGTKVVFIHGSVSGAEIETISVNAASGIPPTTVLSSDGTHSNFRFPIFSPDASYIVFAYDSGGSSLLGRVNLNGLNFQMIVGGGGRSYSSPSFFPDGVTLLAASGFSSSQYNSLYRVLPGGSTSVVTNAFPAEVLGVANRAVLSSDGSQVALDMHSSSGASWLYAYNVAGNTFKRLVFYPAAPFANAVFPTWVGVTQVGYSSDFGGNDQVYVIAASAMDGSGTLRVPSATEPYYAPN